MSSLPSTTSRRHGLDEERRWSARLAIRGPVNLFCQQHAAHGRRVAVGRFTDIGLEGMFIETDIDALDVTCALEVGFSLAGVEGMVEHRIPVRVIRRTRMGIGVGFLRFDPSLFRDVQAMLGGAANGYRRHL